MASYRILVTGSRTWTNRRIIQDVLGKVAAENAHGFKIILVHGDARGVDRIAAEYARLFGWSIEKHPARWDEHDDQCPQWHHGQRTCKRAGMRRNQHMVDLRADICLAFIKDKSPGATACARMAETAGIPVKRYLA